MTTPAPATDPVASIARASAARLATTDAPHVAAEVERAIYARDATPEQYFDPISLGALIVSVAALAWQIYTDRRRQTTNPGHDAVARLVRIEVSDRDATLDPARRDQIIDVVVGETLARDHHDGAPADED